MREYTCGTTNVQAMLRTKVTKQHFPSDGKMFVSAMAKFYIDARTVPAKHFQY